MAAAGGDAPTPSTNTIPHLQVTYIALEDQSIAIEVAAPWLARSDPSSDCPSNARSAAEISAGSSAMQVGRAFYEALHSSANTQSATFPAREYIDVHCR